MGVFWVASFFWPHWRLLLTNLTYNNIFHWLFNRCGKNTDHFKKLQYLFGKLFGKYLFQHCWNFYSKTKRKGWFCVPKVSEIVIERSAPTEPFNWVLLRCLIIDSLSFWIFKDCLYAWQRSTLHNANKFLQIY